jgi:hypothetical protein
MTINASRRAFLFLAMVAVGSAAFAAGPAIAKPTLRPQARPHQLARTPVPHAAVARPKNAIEDPFASLFLG